MDPAKSGSSSSGGKLFTIHKWKRSTKINNNLPYTNFKSSEKKTGIDFWRSIKPSFKCPKGSLVKVGEVGDAGKWVCGVHTLGQLKRKHGDAAPCMVYSTGSKQNVFFEVEMLARTNCTIYSYEPSAAIVDHPLRYFEDRVHLSSVKIGGEDSSTMRTLKTLMRENGGHVKIDVLKLDVGETEDIRTLNKIVDDFGDEESLPIGQLLVRLRVTDWQDSNVTEKIRDAFEGLETKGLRLLFISVNRFVKDYSVADLSFINGQMLHRFLQENDLYKYKHKD